MPHNVEGPVSVLLTGPSNLWITPLASDSVDNFHLVKLSALCELLRC